jgi:ubiquinone/menaquinone biosynthesis C-methylase UbiE
MMKEKRRFQHSAASHVLYKLIALAMESPLRRTINDPLEALTGAGLRPGMEVLEVGCGTGFFTIPAAHLVGREGSIHAIDLHPLALEEVSRKVKEAHVDNVTIRKADAVETGLPDSRFDVILLFGVIPSPTLPYRHLLPEMNRMLNKNGTLAVWTVFPFLLVRSITKDGLFTYMGKKLGVHTFMKTDMVSNTD